jgi:Sigma-70, region 4
LGTSPGPGGFTGITATGLCALGFLGAGAITAHAQVNLPTPPPLPPAPSVPAPLPVPSVPSVPALPPPPPLPPAPALPAAPSVDIPPVPGVTAPPAGGSGGGPVTGAVGGSAGPAGDPAPAGPGAGGGGALGAGGGAALGAGAGASGSAPGGGGRGTRARSGDRPLLSARERAVRRRVVERRRERLVRRLSGCLDALPRMERTTLILRYGVGPVRARSGRQAARLLDISRGRVRLLERRAVRSLADAGRETSCERTGISQISLVAVYDILTGTFSPTGSDLPAPLTAGARLARAAAAALDEGEGVVAGVRESSEVPRRPDPTEPEDDGPASSAGPSLGDPFEKDDSGADDPMLLLLLAIVVASLASAAREIRRAVR